jgi:hypothetical protein
MKNVIQRAILRTLSYSDIFDFPLKAWEIHKWLIGERASLRDVELELGQLLKRKKIGSIKGYYFLGNRKGLVKKREEREKISEEHLAEVKSIMQLFKIVPWLRLVGISGSLAMKNSDKSDDIDLFLVTGKGRLFLTRLLILFLLETLGRRRKRREKDGDVYKKYCVNILLEEDSLAQQDNNIYIAHEVLQMVPVWERGGIYSKYLEENEWVFGYLPNWLTTVGQDEKLKIKDQKYRLKIKNFKGNSLVNFLESVVRKFQLSYMGEPQGRERIGEGSLYFLPEDRSESILKIYKDRIGKI